MRIFATKAHSKITLSIVMGLILSSMLALSGCTATAVPATQGTPDATGTDLNIRGFVDSADGALRVSGKAGLLLSLARQANPPTAPAGWELVGPVFDITAQDHQRRPVRQLASTLLLRFNVIVDRPLTVLVYDGQGWQVVESELDADGLLTASVNHLTPYAVGAPRGSGPARTVSPSRVTPASTRTVPVRGTPQPRVTTTTAPVASTDAQSALSAAVKALKGKSVKITQAAGYTGNLYVAVPSTLQGSLGAALSAGGSGYYGIYNAVNEAVTVQGSGGNASGALTLLVEPKTTMPASASDAQTQLAALFPGVTATLTPAQAASNATTTAYVFYGVSGNTAYSLGYVSYQGVPLAYAVAGSGSYQAYVPR